MLIDVSLSTFQPGMWTARVIGAKAFYPDGSHLPRVVDGYASPVLAVRALLDFLEMMADPVLGE